MYWFILLIPIIICAVAKIVYDKQITVKEMLISMGLTVVIVAGVLASGVAFKSSDTEVLNGQVLEKEWVRVSCSHTYDCFCTTDKNGNRTCQTCHEHAYDIDWDVITNIGTFTIDRIDRQGLQEPERWTQVQIGEPVSGTHGYDNWVKAVPESLFHEELSDEEAAKLPDYPLGVYDYWHLVRVLISGNVGMDQTTQLQWNSYLENITKTLGPTKQANLVVVLTDDPDFNFANMLRQKWIGAKKNDIVVVVGVKDHNYTKGSNWVKVFSWAKYDVFNEALQTDLQNTQAVQDPRAFFTIINTDTTAKFERRPMKDFEYLRSQIEPPTWCIVTGFILAILLSVGLSVFMQRNDVV